MVWVAGDEVTVAEGFRVGVELVARGTDSLGKVGANVHGVKGSVMGGRAAQEPTCSRRSTGAPRRRGLGRSRAPGLCWVAGVAREVLVVVVKLFAGCRSEEEGYKYARATSQTKAPEIDTLMETSLRWFFP